MEVGWSHNASHVCNVILPDNQFKKEKEMCEINNILEYCQYVIRPGMVAHACNFSARESEAGGGS
jgi:hypothetical protein